MTSAVECITTSDHHGMNSRYNPRYAAFQGWRAPDTVRMAIATVPLTPSPSKDVISAGPRAIASFFDEQWVQLSPLGEPWIATVAAVAAALATALAADLAADLTGTAAVS